MLAASERPNHVHMPLPRQSMWLDSSSMIPRTHNTRSMICCDYDLPHLVSIQGMHYRLAQQPHCYQSLVVGSCDCIGTDHRHQQHLWRRTSIRAGMARWQKHQTRCIDPTSRVRRGHRAHAQGLQAQLLGTSVTIARVVQPQKPAVRCQQCRA
jgi:hypothetical protein